MSKLILRLFRGYGDINPVVAEIGDAFRCTVVLDGMDCYRDGRFIYKPFLPLPASDSFFYHKDAIPPVVESSGNSTIPAETT